MLRYSLQAACSSNIGNCRTHNEDNVFFDGNILPQDNSGIREVWSAVYEKNLAMFGVFDGMGGEADGQIASYLAASSFRDDCERIEQNEMLSESVMLDAIIHMNDAVYMDSRVRRNRMGTTAVLAGVCEDEIYICNVGDSRAFRCRGGILTQLSVDDVERIPPFISAHRRRKPGISQYIGMSSEEIRIEPHIARGNIETGDVFLLCTDGLTDTVDDHVIAEILCQDRRARFCVRELTEQALQHDGRDNVTMIVVKVSDKEE